MNKNRWIVLSAPRISYDKMTGSIRLTETGEELANVWICSEGNFNMWLTGMDTWFNSDDNTVGGIGFDGCENHMGDIVHLYGQGGILKFQKGFHRRWEEDPKEDPIEIRIVCIEKGGEFVYSRTVQRPKRLLREFFADIGEALRETFFQKKAAS